MKRVDKKYVPILERYLKILRYGRVEVSGPPIDQDRQEYSRKMEGGQETVKIRAIRESSSITRKRGPLPHPKETVHTRSETQSRPFFRPRWRPSGVMSKARAPQDKTPAGPPLGLRPKKGIAPENVQALFPAPKKGPAKKT